MKPFDDPEASRKRPADVLAYVAEVEARANNATPGPWAVIRDEADEDDPLDTIYSVSGFGPWTHVEHKDIDAFATVGDADGKDAEFIVNARSDVPALIAIVREQETSIAAALRLYEGMVEQHNNVSAQNTALRERLAKLETAIDSTLDGLYGLSFTPNVFDEIAKKRLDELRRARST